MAIGDQYFDKVVLALPCDGDGVVDKSISKKAITAVGDAKISSTQSKFGGYGAYFDGTGDYLALTSTTDFGFGTDDFTVEGWVYPTSTVGADRTITDFRETNVAGTRWTFFIDAAAGKLAVWDGTTKYGASGTAVPTNQWSHVACTRSSGTLKVFLNGAQDFSASFSVDLGATKPLGIGAQSTGSGVGGSPFVGYMDCIRITKGYARYTSAFTPSSTALPFYMAQLTGIVEDSSANPVRRLARAHRLSDGMCVDEKLSDPTSGAYTLNCPDQSKHYVVTHDTDSWLTYFPFNGANNDTTFPEWSGKVATPANNVKISTAQYASLTSNSSSAYFDGTGDYLTIPANVNFAFGTDDFTIQTFVRLDSIGTERAIFDTRAVSTDTGLYFGINASNQPYVLGNNATIVTSSTALSATTWYHLALVKYSGTIYLYIGGTSVGSAASSYYITCPNTLVIGRKLGSTTNDFIGYMDDLVIQKGKAQYTSSFSTPTTAFSTPAENALIFDYVVPE